MPTFIFAIPRILVADIQKCRQRLVSCSTPSLSFSLSLFLSCIHRILILPIPFSLEPFQFSSHPVRQCLFHSLHLTNYFFFFLFHLNFWLFHSLYISFFYATIYSFYVNSFIYSVFIPASFSGILVRTKTRIAFLTKKGQNKSSEKFQLNVR